MLAKWLNWSLLTAVNWIQDVPSHLQRAQHKTDECESLQLVLSAKTAENITVLSKSPKLSGSTGLSSTVKYILGSHKKEDFKCKWRVGESKGGPSSLKLYETPTESCQESILLTASLLKDLSGCQISKVIFICPSGKENY